MPRADRIRDWVHNISARPNVVVHLKQDVVADVPATERVITDPDERQPLIEAAAQRWARTDVENMIEYSPLIVLSIDGDSPDRPSTRGGQPRHCRRQGLWAPSGNYGSNLEPDTGAPRKSADA